MHNKVKELQLRASTITYSDISANQAGTMIEDRTIKGYLIAWGVKDDWGTIMVKGCCAKSLQDRGVNSNSNYKITLLWQHDQSEPIGRFTTLQEDNYGLYFEAEIDRIEEGDRVLEQIRSGTLNCFSVGFDYVWDKVDYDEKEDALVLKEIQLYEGSVVTIPSNMGTYAIRSGKSLEDEKSELIKETDEVLKNMPVQRQFAIKQLIERHTSLARVKPQEEALNEHKPTSDAIDYNYLLKHI